MIARFKAKNDGLQALQAISTAEKLKKYITSNVVSTSLPNKSNTPKTNPKKFTDIFVDPNKVDFYVNALAKTTPQLVSNTGNFVGKPRGHKGVIASWIIELQHKGLINNSINREKLACVLNNEINGLDISKDGRILSLYSKLYETSFKSQLLKITNLD